MTEQFAIFRRAYMDEYLNNRDDGSMGRQVLTDLVAALEKAMVCGIDVVKTKDEKIALRVGYLHQALVQELTLPKEGA